MHSLPSLPVFLSDILILKKKKKKQLPRTFQILGKGNTSELYAELLNRGGREVLHLFILC